MTTTDDRAERLARLQARRTAPDAPTSAATPISAAATAPGATSAAATPARRRSPALSAKVLTVGASTSAMLGMMAGYGIAEGHADQLSTLEPAVGGTTDLAAPATTLPTPTTLASTTPPPQVIVVMIDGETGLPIDPGAIAAAALDGEVRTVDTSLPTTAAEAATPVTPPATPAAATPAPPATPAAPSPDEATDTQPASDPRPVAVAVPTPEPAPAPAPTPAPAPEATSSGS